MPKHKSKPRRNKNAEIILRTFTHYWSDHTMRDDEQIQIPAFMILANRAGFRWLSQYFAMLAEREWATSSDIGDPDDHQHLDRAQTPINLALSEKMEVRLGCLTSENRRAVMSKYEIKRQTRTGRVRAGR